MCFELLVSLVFLQRPNDHVDLMDLPTVGMQTATRSVTVNRSGGCGKKAKQNIVLSVGVRARYQQA